VTEPIRESQKVSQQQMPGIEARDFGELYRAAFAEVDPARKLELLAQVRLAIVAWEQAGAEAPAEASKAQENTADLAWNAGSSMAA